MQYVLALGSRHDSAEAHCFSVTDLVVIYCRSDRAYPYRNYKNFFHSLFRSGLLGFSTVTELSPSSPTTSFFYENCHFSSISPKNQQSIFSRIENHKSNYCHLSYVLCFLMDVSYIREHPFYADISNHHQMQQYKSCLKSVL